MGGEPTSFPDTSLKMAFSREAAPLLEAAELPFSPGAGGVKAMLDGASLVRLEGGPLHDAIGAAYEGWARNRYDWRLGHDRVLPLGGRPRIMGILNVTPDSFSDGGLYLSRRDALRQAKAMADAGAQIIDVGGESTRPGSEPVTAPEEIDRTLPVVRAVAEGTGALVSIDTTKAEVAEAALRAGASIINDVSGLTFDRDMARVAARASAGVVIMHMRGTPKDMQKDPHFDDTLAEIALELRERVQIALEAGIGPEGIVLDPGIGFGKRLEDNLRLLARLGELRSLGFPLLLGASRKSFFGLITNREAGERDLETAVVSVLAALAGVQVLRVHHVEMNLRCLQVAEAVLGQRREAVHRRG
jgi:dihydropteroate synthase